LKIWHLSTDQVKPGGLSNKTITTVNKTITTINKTITTVNKTITTVNKTITTVNKTITYNCKLVRLSPFPRPIFSRKTEPNH
jgi:hypothetical protein